MAAFVLTDAAVYVGAANLTGYSNKVELAATREQKESTTFGSAGWKERKAGLASCSSKLEGLWDAGTGILPDDRLFADLGTAGVPYTVAPLGATDGNLAYFTSSLRTSYTPGAAIGEMFKFSSDMMSDKPLVRGTIIHPSTSAKTSTGTGVARQIGTASSSQRIYMALHVLAVSGSATPTLTVTVQSDNAEGFPSAATVATFTAATAIGGQFTSVAGPLTDDWYRVSYTISGTSPSFTFVVVTGITAP